MKLLDSNRFLLPVRGASGYMLHLATVEDGVHEYLCFYLSSTGQVYIEEVTGGHLEVIESLARHETVVDFLTRQGVLDGSPLLPDEWKEYNPDEDKPLSPELQRVFQSLP